MLFDLDAYLAQLRDRINQTLAERLPRPERNDPLQLREAMGYALLDGGKRLRPCLAVAACQAVGGTLEAALGPACALEMVHAYSLVHDDLPAMDNDDSRRGQPTCHKRFGETSAILVGDALLTLAFETLAADWQAGSEETGSSARLLTRAVHELARAAGARGMVGGQAMDMAIKKLKPSFEELELCQAGKTAALFSAATTIGAIVGGGSEAQIELLRSYGFDLGLAYQHADDMEDAEFVAYRDRAHQRALDLARRAGRTAARLEEPGAPLTAMAAWVEQRAREFHQAGTTRRS